MGPSQLCRAMVHVPHRNCAAIKLLLHLASSYLLKIILSHTHILLILCVVFRNFQWCAESPSESTEKKQHFKDIIWSWDGEGNRNGSCQGEAVSKGISISCWFCSVSFIHTCITVVVELAIHFCRLTSITTLNLFWAALSSKSIYVICVKWLYQYYYFAVAFVKIGIFLIPVSLAPGWSFAYMYVRVGYSIIYWPVCGFQRSVHIGTTTCVEVPGTYAI